MHSNEYTTSDFPRDRALPFFADASYAELAKVLPMPRCATKRQEKVIAGIVAGMAHHVRMRPSDQYISYSRDMSVYPGQELYYGVDWGYSPVVSSIDKLAADGWMLHHDRKQQQTRAIGQRSRFLPNPDKFKSVVLPKTRKSIGQLIRLRDRKERVLIPFRETEAVARMRRFVEKVNGHLREADIQFHGGVRRDGSICYFESFDEGKVKTSAVDLDDIELYRVFSDVWSLGGRFYGGSWQGVPKGDRKHFILDGEPVVEHDYKNNHPSFLYIAEGKPLDLDSDYDAYDIAGFRDQRLACKRALNILLNAKDLGRAIGAIREHVASETFEEAKELIEAIKVKHSVIAHYFHSDVGLKLQRLDADMCQQVLNEITIKRGVTCLPLHDSFIVPQSSAEELVLVMSSAFKKCTAKVTNTSFVSKTSGLTILNTGAACRAGRGGPGGVGAAASETESIRNRRENQNRRTIHSKTKGGAMRRFGRIRTRTIETAATDTPMSISIAPSEVEQEQRRANPVECTRNAQVRFDTVNAPERTVDPVSDDCRHDTEVHEKPKAIWQPRRTTVLELIREEERRRDARRNGKLKSGRE